MAIATEATPQKPAHSPRRLIICVILAGLLLVGGYYVLVATSLHGLPDLPPPFDPERDGIIDIRPQDNAFTYYIRAYDQLQKTDLPGLRWTWPTTRSIDSAQAKYLEDNRAALATWFEGSKRNNALYHQPKDLNYLTKSPTIFFLHTLTGMANLMALRYENEGDYGRAWEYYRASLRSSRHLGQNGSGVERVQGNEIYVRTSQNIITWADNPKVGLQLLKQALEDVIDLDAMTGSARATIRTEYFTFINSLDDPALLKRLNLPNSSTPTSPWMEKNQQKLSTVYSYLIREPERSKRVARLMVANWLSVADLSAVERNDRSKIIESTQLFTPSPDQEPLMPLERLASWNASSMYARTFQYQWGQLEGILIKDEQTRVQMIIHLASRIYLREHGKLPTSPQDLVGPYLKELPAGYSPETK